jgi:hypothetical protein
MGCLFSICEQQAAERETPGPLLIIDGRDDNNKIQSYYLAMQRPGHGQSQHRPDNKRARSKFPRSR